MPDTSQSNHNQQDILAASAARGIRATAWGIVASTCLAVVKVVGGIVRNSYALVADGVESMVDIMSSMVVWGSLRIASQPMFLRRLPCCQK
ncbi:MAG: cation transporter [Verrucomicrobiales bacterium]